MLTLSSKKAQNMSAVKSESAGVQLLLSLTGQKIFAIDRHSFDGLWLSRVI
jgi:hypothetical protein